MAVLEDLTDEEAYLFAILDDQSGLDLAEFTWVDQEEDDGCFRCWPFQWSWFRTTEPLQIDQCFPSGTLVLTEDGHKPIEEIKVGERVLTHLGRWKAVTHVFDRGEQETVYVKGHGHWGLQTTPDHEFFMDGGFKAPAVGDRWASPSAVGELGIPSLPGNYPSGRQNVPSLKSDVQVDTFLWLYGLYLAEGSLSSSYGKGGKLNRVTWSVHDDEVKYVTDSLDVLGVRYSVWDSPNGAVSNVVAHSKPWAKWLLANGGKGARNKHIAGWVLGHPRREMVQHGLLVGDGHYRDGRWTLSTVSKRLCFDFKVLAQTLGHSASVSTRTAARSSINGRDIVPTGPSYAVDIQLLCDQKKPHVRAEPLHVRSLVKKITDGERVQCWDFEVEDDHSYIAESIVVHNCARSVGKSMSIKMRAFVFPFVHPGKEMVITGPEGVHVDAITDLVETQFYSTRLGREMLVGGRYGVKHKPFHMNFANGARIMGRIPQNTGKGVKGIHPIWLELDEAQDYPPAGWTELVETLKRGFKGAVWRAHGVTRGVRDKFYEFTDDTNPKNRWFVHRFTAMHRPNWTDDERQEKIDMYNGSKDDPDYRRNVLGMHGDATNPIFVLHRLMKCVDDDTGSDYNVDEYQHYQLSDRFVDEQDITSLLPFPSRHLNDYLVNGKRAKYWCGMDIGFTRDPSEILVFVQHSPTQKWDKEKQKYVPIAKDQRRSQLKLLTRISLKRIKVHDQAAVIKHVIGFYQPQAFAMDKHGPGIGLYQMVMEDPAINQVIRGYGHSDKPIVEIDEAVEVDEFTGEIVKDALMKRNMLEYSTDKLREMVDSWGIYLPWDKNLIAQFQGATETARQRGQDQYGRSRTFSSGEDHALDACRQAAMAYAQETIEEVLKEDKFVPVMDTFITAW